MYWVVEAGIKDPDNCRLEPGANKWNPFFLCYFPFGKKIHTSMADNNNNSKREYKKWYKNVYFFTGEIFLLEFPLISIIMKKEPIFLHLYS